MPKPVTAIVLAGLFYLLMYLNYEVIFVGESRLPLLAVATNWLAFFAILASPWLFYRANSTRQKLLFSLGILVALLGYVLLSFFFWGLSEAF